MKDIIVSFFIGIIGGVGLFIAQMTDPKKVIGFLDITGNWDPSLMFVMVGAIAVYAVAYPFITKRPKPILTEKFGTPTNKTIDKKLLAGASLFGIGWGITGICPAVVFLNIHAGSYFVIFTVAMFFGMYLFKLYDQHQTKVENKKIEQHTPQHHQEIHKKAS